MIGSVALLCQVAFALVLPWCCECALERSGDTYSLPTLGSDPVFSGPAARYVVTAQAAGARCAVPADFDGDDAMDVVSVSSLDNSIAWYKRLPDGTYGPKQMISRASNGARIVTVGDINRDNRTDVVVASYYDHTIGWFMNLGGSFGPKNVITKTATAAQGVSVSDLDNDGDLDVLVASSGDDTVAWFENLGEGTFCEVKRVVDSQAKGVRTVVAADLNNDGFVDLASASKDDGTIAWYRNDGLLKFEKIVIDSKAKGAYSLVAKDVDQDGRVDLVTAANTEGLLEENGEGGLVSLYQNNIDNGSSYSGGFQKIAVTVGNSTGQNDFDWFVLSVWAGDLDGDGDVDIASASFSLRHQGGISWYENADGLGKTWTRHRIYISPISGTGHYVFGEDMDGDGDTDLLAVTHSDNKVHILYANTSCDSAVPMRNEACCTAAKQYWNGSSCVSCKLGTFVDRQPGRAATCSPCSKACSRRGLDFIPASCHSTATACAASALATAMAKCDCGKNEYLSKFSTCVPCPEGLVTDEGATRTVSDHVMVSKTLQDGTEYYISDLVWSGFDSQRCKIVEPDYTWIVLLVGGSSVAATVCILLTLCCARQYLLAVKDCPSNPQSKTGSWVLKCAGPHVQERLEHRRGRRKRSTFAKPRYVVNATPFEIAIKDEHTTSNVLLEPYQFRRTRRSFAGQRLELRVRNVKNEDECATSLVEDLLTEVDAHDWRHTPSEVDCNSPNAIHYDFPVVRRKLPASCEGKPMGDLKLILSKAGSLLLTWSPPHTLRGIPMDQFIAFLQEVIDSPKCWKSCEDIDERGLKITVDKPSGSLKRNMYDACKHIVLPHAAQVDASYAEIFADVGLATLFVSHVWAEYVGETLSAMMKLKMWLRRSSCTFDRPGEKTNIWFCTLCNNQSRVVEELGSDVLLSPFAQVIRSPYCSHVAMVSPFRALGRKWCNYEFCLAHSEDKSVAMLTSDGVVQAGHVPPKKLVDLSAKVMKFKSRDSTCSSSSDSQFIDEAIDKMGGYEATDEMLRTLFYTVISEAYEYLGQSLTNMSCQGSLRLTSSESPQLDRMPSKLVDL